LLEDLRHQCLEALFGSIIDCLKQVAKSASYSVFELAAERHGNLDRSALKQLHPRALCSEQSVFVLSNLAGPAEKGILPAHQFVDRFVDKIGKSVVVFGKRKQLSRCTYIVETLPRAVHDLNAVNVALKS
jgi:hypothetical protein